MLIRLLALVLLAGCATVPMDSIWDAKNRVLWFPSEATAGAECYRRGARVPSQYTQGGVVVGCYIRAEDIIIMSDYRIGVPSQPSILRHEQHHRSDAKAGKDSWHP